MSPPVADIEALGVAEVDGDDDTEVVDVELSDCCEGDIEDVDVVEAGVGVELADTMDAEALGDGDGDGLTEADTGDGVTLLVADTELVVDIELETELDMDTELERDVELVGVADI